MAPNSINQNETIIEETTDLPEPPKFTIIIYNDDYTPIDFVTLILRRIFRKSNEAANQIAMDAHNNGKAVVGTYTAEIAEMKLALVQVNARNRGFPFRCEAHPT